MELMRLTFTFLCFPLFIGSSIYTRFYYFVFALELILELIIEVDLIRIAHLLIDFHGSVSIFDGSEFGGFCCSFRHCFSCYDVLGVKRCVR